VQVTALVSVYKMTLHTQWPPFHNHQFSGKQLQRNEKPTDVTVSILFMHRRISTCFGPTGPSSGEFTQLFPQPLVQYPYRSGRVFCLYTQNTWPERYRYWTNGCGNSGVNSPEDGPVGPKHVEIRQYMNKIQTVTSVGFLFLMLKRCMVQKA